MLQNFTNVLTTLSNLNIQAVAFRSISHHRRDFEHLFGVIALTYATLRAVRVTERDCDERETIEQALLAGNYLAVGDAIDAPR